MRPKSKTTKLTNGRTKGPQSQEGQMLKTIYGYELAAGFGKISMPKNAEILSVGLDQNGNLCVWALTDPDDHTTHRQYEIRLFECIGTGVRILERTDYSRKFLGTAVMAPFVIHVFELVEKDE